jgi:hypothetical protein
MTTTLKSYLTWVEDTARQARRGDVDSFRALVTFALVAGGKAKQAAREAILEIEAEAEAERAEAA